MAEEQIAGARILLISQGNGSRSTADRTFGVLPMPGQRLTILAPPKTPHWFQNSAAGSGVTPQASAAP